MIKRLILILWIVIFCLPSPYCLADIAYRDLNQYRSMALMELSAPVEVIEAAKNGLSDYLARISPGEMNAWGLSEKGQLKEVTLMAPYKVYTINEDYIFNYTFETDFLSVLDPASLWYFPVNCAGRYKAILKVEQKNGIWQIVDIRDKRLARDLQTIERRWSQTNGYNLALFIVNGQDAVFVIINKLDRTVLFPVDLTRRSFPFKPELYEPYEVIKIIKRYMDYNG